MANFGLYSKSLSYATVMLVSLMSFISYYLKSASFTIGHIGFGLLFTLGFIGVFKYGMQTSTIIINKVFATSRTASKLYVLPTLVTEVYLRNNIFPDLSYAHLILPAFVYYPLTYSKSFQERLDKCVFMCTVSLSLVSIYIDNLYGLYAAFVYAILQFNITNHGYLFGLSSTYFYNFGLTIFSVLLYYALDASEFKYHSI